ncbi:microneme protein mic14 [Babesia caballi]|uniref:Microneme protein mic14 n=1 Tax=Babesia caballi TaxID=5871 RepID=A0AAV4LUN5_BABCB|nr:microneme protein mic14 [Babesia caballi]
MRAAGALALLFLAVGAAAEEQLSTVYCSHTTLSKTDTLPAEVCRNLCFRVAVNCLAEEKKLPNDPMHEGVVVKRSCFDESVAVMTQHCTFAFDDAVDVNMPFYSGLTSTTGKAKRVVTFEEISKPVVFAQVVAEANKDRLTVRALVEKVEESSFAVSVTQLETESTEDDDAVYYIAWFVVGESAQLTNFGAYHVHLQKLAVNEETTETLTITAKQTQPRSNNIALFAQEQSSHFQVVVQQAVTENQIDTTVTTKRRSAQHSAEDEPASTEVALLYVDLDYFKDDAKLLFGSVPVSFPEPQQRKGGIEVTACRCSSALVFFTPYYNRADNEVPNASCVWDAASTAEVRYVCQFKSDSLVTLAQSGTPNVAFFAVHRITYSDPKDLIQIWYGACNAAYSTSGEEEREAGLRNSTQDVACKRRCLARYSACKGDLQSVQVYIGAGCAIEGVQMPQPGQREDQAEVKSNMHLHILAYDMKGAVCTGVLDAITVDELAKHRAELQGSAEALCNDSSHHTDVMVVIDGYLTFNFCSGVLSGQWDMNWESIELSGDKYMDGDRADTVEHIFRGRRVYGICKHEGAVAIHRYFGQSADMHEFREHSPSVDCVESEWEDWGPCSAECIPDGSQVVRRRVRYVIRPRSGDGRKCVTEETKPCTSDELPACSDICLVTQWSEWSDCVGSTQRRERYVKQYTEHCDQTNLMETQQCSFNLGDDDLSGWEGVIGGDGPSDMSPESGQGGSMGDEQDDEYYGSIDYGMDNRVGSQLDDDEYEGQFSNMHMWRGDDDETMQYGGGRQYSEDWGDTDFREYGGYNGMGGLDWEHYGLGSDDMGDGAMRTDAGMGDSSHEGDSGLHSTDSRWPRAMAMEREDEEDGHDEAHHPYSAYPSEHEGHTEGPGAEEDGQTHSSMLELYKDEEESGCELWSEWSGCTAFCDDEVGYEYQLSSRTDAHSTYELCHENRVRLCEKQEQCGLMESIDCDQVKSAYFFEADDEECRSECRHLVSQCSGESGVDIVKCFARLKAESVEFGGFFFKCVMPDEHEETVQLMHSLFRNKCFLSRASYSEKTGSWVDSKTQSCICSIPGSVPCTAKEVHYTRNDIYRDLVESGFCPTSVNFKQTFVNRWKEKAAPDSQTYVSLAGNNRLHCPLPVDEEPLTFTRFEDVKLEDYCRHGPVYAEAKARIKSPVQQFAHNYDCATAASSNGSVSDSECMSLCRRIRSRCASKHDGYLKCIRDRLTTDFRYEADIFRKYGCRLPPTLDYTFDEDYYRVYVTTFEAEQMYKKACVMLAHNAILQCEANELLKNPNSMVRCMATLLGDVDATPLQVITPFDSSENTATKFKEQCRFDPSRNVGSGYVMCRFPADSEHYENWSEWSACTDSCNDFDRVATRYRTRNVKEKFANTFFPAGQGALEFGLCLHLPGCKKARWIDSLSETDPNIHILKYSAYKESQSEKSQLWLEQTYTQYPELRSEVSKDVTCQIFRSYKIMSSKGTTCGCPRGHTPCSFATAMADPLWMMGMQNFCRQRPLASIGFEGEISDYRYYCSLGMLLMQTDYGGTLACEYFDNNEYVACQAVDQKPLTLRSKHFTLMGICLGVLFCFYALLRHIVRNRRIRAAKQAKHD